MKSKQSGMLDVILAILAAIFVLQGNNSIGIYLLALALLLKGLHHSSKGSSAKKSSSRKSPKKRKSSKKRKRR